VPVPVAVAVPVPVARGWGVGAPSPSPGPSMPPHYVEPPSGDADFNPTLQAFLKVQPPGVNMKASVPATAQSFFELNPLLQGANFYEYAGSLTAPPCAEIATWLVRTDVIKASDKQVLYLHDAIYKANADFGNYRILMPLSSRTVSMKQSTLEDPPKQSRPDVPMPGSPQQSDREFRAMKWSMDAMTIAKGATNYIKDLDTRMRNAAQAHADALASRLDPLTIDGKLLGPGGTPSVANGRTFKMADSPLPTFQMAGPIPMENVAQSMAGALAEAARGEVEDATRQISEQSKVLAMEAAKQAAGIVSTGFGNHNVLANAVVHDTGFPH